MPGKWLLQTPPISQPNGGTTYREWRFETKTKMLEFCSRKGLNIFKKAGLKYTYIIGNPSKDMMRYR